MRLLDRLTVVLALACGLTLVGGCCQSFGGDEPGGGEIVPSPPPSTPPPLQPGPPSAPVKTQPGQPGTQIVFGSEGNAPGGMKVSVDGQNVWPPQGTGCDQYVQCCNAATALASDVALACQLAVATPPVDCPGSRAKMRSYLGERGLAVPQACLAP